VHALYSLPVLVSWCPPVFPRSRSISTEEDKFAGKLEAIGDVKCRKCKVKIDMQAVMEADQVRNHATTPTSNYAN
jgi:hypothetical protein